MPNRVYPPDCMMNVWRVIFPKLKWERISFYDGIPFLYSAYGQKGLTTGTTFGEIRIYVKQGTYDPCDTGITFKRLTHELVHAVQIQSQVLPQIFLWKYLTCFFAEGMFHKHDSCYEAEAMDFADLITQAGNPCTCTFPEPPFANQKWFGPQLDLSGGYTAIMQEIDHDPSGHTKIKSICSLGDCFGDSLFGYIKGGIALVLGTIVAAAGTFFFEGPVAKVTTVIGAVGGMLTGLAAGLGYGGLVSGGLITAVVGAVIGFIGGAFALGLLGAIVDWMIGLFPHKVAGSSLNIVHSTDQGLSFKSKVVFERTREQPSLAASENRLFVAWTGTDDQVNVFVSPDKTKVSLEQSGPCGPAISFLGQLFLGWKGKGNDHPNCMSSVDGVGFGSKFTSGGDGPAESTPGLAAGPALVYMAWVGPDNFIRLINLAPGNPITEKPIPVHKLTFQTGHQRTPALAFGDSTLFLAWSTLWAPHFLNIARFPLNPDGSIDFDSMSSNATNDFTKDSTGPALAFGSKDKRLYLAFTGADNGVWVVSWPNGGLGFDKRCRLPGELSSEVAGPAITVHPSTGTVFLCWVGQDGD